MMLHVLLYCFGEKKISSTLHSLHSASICTPFIGSCKLRYLPAFPCLTAPHGK